MPSAYNDRDLWHTPGQTTTLLRPSLDNHVHITPTTHHWGSVSLLCSLGSSRKDRIQIHHMSTLCFFTVKTFSPAGSNKPMKKLDYRATEGLTVSKQ